MVSATRSRPIEVRPDDDLLADPAVCFANDFLDTAVELGRAPLSNISDDNIVLPEQAARDAELRNLKAAFKKAIGVGKKKGRARKRAKQLADAQLPNIDVLEDSHPSPSSPAAEEVRVLLTSSDEAVLPPVDDAAAPPSQATARVRRQLAKEPPGQFQNQFSFPPDDRVYDQPQSPWDAACFQSIPPSTQFYDALAMMSRSMTNATTNFLSPLVTAQPSPMPAFTEPPEPKVIKEHIENSKPVTIDIFQYDEPTPPPDHLTAAAGAVEPLGLEIVTPISPQSQSLSPPRSITRIEDSVEELDRLEEELEFGLQTLDQVVSTNRAVSPNREKAQTRLIPSEKRNSVSLTKSKSTHELREPPRTTTKRSSELTSSATSGSLRVKSTQSRASLEIRRTKSAILKAPESQDEADETGTKPETKRVVVKRPTSLLPPKPLVKSTKPLTRPSFELPGEAIAQELKQRREARLSQASVSAPIPTSNPARAKRLSQVPPFELPGEVLSRKKREQHEARLRQQAEEEKRRREFKARPVPASICAAYKPRDTAASRARQVATQAGDNDASFKRRSAKISLRPSIAITSAALTSSTRQRPSPARPSMQQSQRTVSAEEARAQRQRAKEIYKRDSQLVHDMAEEKRRREESARRAREEAAERGRQSSRDWAQKQRAKKMMETARGLSMSSSLSHLTDSDL